MSLFILKLLGAILLWFIMLCFGLVPFKVKYFRTNQTLLTISNCFSGGLFLSIGLIHILPEARAKLEGNYETNKELSHKEPFPWSYMICLFTFSCILFIDKVILPKINNNKTNHINHNNLYNKNEDRLIFKDNSKSYKSDDKIEDKYIELNDSIKFLQDGRPYTYLEDINLKNDKFSALADTNLKNDIQINDSLIEHGEKEIKMLESKKKVKKITNEQKKRLFGNKTRENSDQNTNEDLGYTGNRMFGAFMLLIAMGIHGFFAGIAFGISRSVSESFNMFVAIITHKWSEALTVGVSLISSNINYEKSVYMILGLSLVTPIGVFVGYLISGMNDNIVGIALAISSGTFLYISFMEILVNEFESEVQGFRKFSSYCVGIMFTVFITFMD